ncbi:condensation domain-containing protein [Planktothricoides sp. SR001]|uniref:non-ribosomal peptide synthetase n=1 Tax=Planktothricoides sp. SR001 TaxID=1705388 RepID=UPI0009E9F6E1|nr:condensation domain-containing protein [Planktothricoides sp. SR001]
MMNDINNRIAKLSPAKRKLLEQRLQQKVKEANRQLTIPPRENPHSAPLSYAQERMWLLDKLEPGNPAYNRPLNIRLTGSLNVVALEKSINEIVRRHEIFRTSFSIIDGQPIQAIAPSMTVNLPIVQLSHLPINEREKESDIMATEAAQHKFDLSQLPLITAKLLHLSETENILLLTMHHIIFDGWSVAVLLKELAAHYQAFVMGEASPLLPLPIQYADFAIWQRQRLQGEVLESQLAYWKKQLSGSLPVLELPTDRRRSPVQTFRGAKQDLLLPKHLSESLKELSLREEVTLFMTLLATFQILLYRYTGEEDMIVGTPIAGRDRLETENLIGVFINTLVLRCHCDGNSTFREFLNQVRQVALEAFAHQELPFEKLVEELKPDRDLSHTPIFQVLFQLRNLPQSSVTAAGIGFEELKGDREITAFDLTLDILETSSGLVCSFNYNRDLFDAATIERMAGHFQLLLSGIVANPQQPIFQLPLLTKKEQDQLLVAWNDTATDYPQDKCIHQLFEEQVERTPDAVAVVFENEKLTYRQLNNRANQLAHYLRSLGVKSEVLVGICVERSLEMIVGLLGILKAGGAYVPLDPNYPSARFNYIINDTCISILLTQHHLIDKLSTLVQHIVCLDTKKEVILQYAQSNCSFKMKSNNLAYVIYTSGSTGNPKGVLIEHKSVVNFLHFRNEQIFRKHELKAGTLTTSICFDASVAQIFSPLIIGGKLVIISQIENLFTWVNKEQITCLTTVPSLLEQLLKNFTLPSCVRAIGLGGESVTETLLEKLGKYPNLKKIFNLYGPTEATIGSLIGIIYDDSLDAF